MCSLDLMVFAWVVHEVRKKKEYPNTDKNMALVREEKTGKAFLQKWWVGLVLEGMGFQVEKDLPGGGTTWTKT